MYKKIVPASLFALVLIFVFSVTTVFGAAKIGEPLNYPEKGWDRYSYTSPEITYEGNWWVGNVAKHSTNKDASFKFNFEGTSFRIITQNYGYVDTSDNISVIVDGKITGKLSLQDIPYDYYNSRLAYELSGLEYGDHTVEFVNNQSNKHILLTAIDLQQGSQLKPYDPDAINSPKLSVTSVTYAVYLNQTFDVQISLDNVNYIYAEDFTIQYDKTRFRLEEVAVDNKLMLAHQSDTGALLRLITASKGKYNGIHGKSKLVNLKFRAIGLGDGKIQAVQAKIADNGTREIDLLSGNLGGRTFTVVGSSEFSLKHLGVLAYYYEDDKAKLPQNLQNVVGGQGTVGEVDLTQLVKSILSNPHYNVKS